MQDFRKNAFARKDSMPYLKYSPVLSLGESSRELQGNPFAVENVRLSSRLKSGSVTSYRVGWVGRPIRLALARFDPAPRPTPAFGCTTEVPVQQYTFSRGGFWPHTYCSVEASFTGSMQPLTPPCSCGRSFVRRTFVFGDEHSMQWCVSPCVVTEREESTIHTVAGELGTDAQ